MADFKNHVSFGAATGFLLSVLTYMLDWVTHLYFVVLIFFATIVGSILPDTDSDSGLPVKIVFGLYAYSSAAIVMFYSNELKLNIFFKIILPTAAFLFVHIILKRLFKKVTNHRGIFHSVPAFLIIFFLTLVVADTTHLKTLEKFVLALALSVGYFSHLVLDEIYSVNFFVPRKTKNKSDNKFSLKKYFKMRLGVKRSFGTAVDLGFKQKRKYPVIIAYVILIILIYLSYPLMLKIFNLL